MRLTSPQVGERHPVLWFFVVIILVSSAAMVRAEQVFTSPPTHVQLIELFTSQGCSSCPPAEDWLSDWQQDEGLWSRVIPVAFHVDYWNRLGWTDPFSDHRYTRRQQRYGSNWGRPAVYTPGFVVDGQEWRGWFERAPLPAGPDTSGVLRLAWDGQVAKITFQPSPETQRAMTTAVVLLGMGQRTAVATGENAGREMVGDFVALGWQETGLYLEDGAWHGAVAVDQEIDGQVRAVAAWVTDRPQGAVLQATGGCLKPPASAR